MSEVASTREPAATSQQLDGQIRDAYAQAEYCARQAKTGDLKERTHWLVLERRWRTLARSIEFKLRHDGIGVETPPAG